MRRLALPTTDALDAITTFSRQVADAEDPEVIPLLLADAAYSLLGAQVVAVLSTTADGSPLLAAVRGVPALVAPDSLDSEAARLLVATVPGVKTVRSWLLTSGGGLFGALVVGFGAAGPAAGRSGLPEAFADIAATGLDRAFRTSELHRTIHELVHSREELARSASLRSLGQMAAVVAHEVKNPLTSIGGVLQVLRKGFTPETQEFAMVGKVLARLAELDRMVDELLAFGRPRAPVRRPTQCRTFLEEIAQMYAQDPAAAQMRVVVDAHEGTADLDPGMFQRVLFNLLLNAAHATNGAGTVTLRCRTGSDRVELVVSDDGPGVPEADRPRLFEPFFTTKVRGSGLGLAVARQVVEAHGGTLTHLPVEPHGASFVIRLPRGPA